MGALTDKKALITGASRGIGKAIALAFAKEGASLALFATSNDKLADTAARCAEAGCKTVHTFGLDVRNSADVDGAVKKASEVLGGLDIVVNNANHWLYEAAEECGLPVGNAILTVDTKEQALARARGGRDGKGGDAARACLRLIEIRRQFEERVS